jgi:hypothetical protein
MYIESFSPPSTSTDTQMYAFVSDDFPEMQLSPKYHSIEACRVWYGQVAHELFDEFDVPMGKL